MVPEKTARRGNLAFEALADPTRRAILCFLADCGESPVGEIAAAVATVSRTGVSNHLRFLRAAELVTERRDGRYRLYSVDGTTVEEVVRFLSALYGSPLVELKRRVEDQAATGEAGRVGRTGTRQ
jgi:DNA-binding transcriptional ArsR family regulator